MITVLGKKQNHYKDTLCILVNDVQAQIEPCRAEARVGGRSYYVDDVPLYLEGAEPWTFEMQLFDKRTQYFDRFRPIGHATVWTDTQKFTWDFQQDRFVDIPTTTWYGRRGYGPSSGTYWKDQVGIDPWDADFQQELARALGLLHAPCPVCMQIEMPLFYINAGKICRKCRNAKEEREREEAARLRAEARGKPYHRPPPLSLEERERRNEEKRERRQLRRAERRNQPFRDWKREKKREYLESQ